MSWDAPACTANTRHRPNAEPMLGQRRRRWPSIGTALNRCLMSLTRCWTDIDSALGRCLVYTDCGRDGQHPTQQHHSLIDSWVNVGTASRTVVKRWSSGGPTSSVCQVAGHHPTIRDREVACSASDRQGSNFESCVWRTVSSQSSHHPQEVLLAQFSLYVHKGGLKPDSFHFITIHGWGPIQMKMGSNYEFFLWSIHIIIFRSFSWYHLACIGTRVA